MRRHERQGRKRQGYRRQGFTLVEMAIVLLIASVVVGGSFAILNTQISQEQETTTQKRLDTIEAALKEYRAVNNRLPCPADGSILPTAALLANGQSPYGTEAVTTYDSSTPPAPLYCRGSSPAANFTAAVHATKPATTLTDVVGGTVPFKTLGLPEEYMYDGYGNKISYHVDGKATEPNAFATYGISQARCFDVVIDDERTWAANADISYLSFHAIYALISHGKDGHGAFTKGGVRKNSGSTNSFEQANANYNASGTATTYSNLFFLIPQTQSSTDNKNVFDDEVRFKTREQLATSYDAPGSAFPDLIIGSNRDGTTSYGVDFYYRCKDRFIMEQSEMVDVNNKRINKISIAPNNEYVIASVMNNRHFEVWNLDGIHTNVLPNDSFHPLRPAGTMQTVQWSSNGKFFLVSAFDDNDSISNGNRIAIYEKNNDGSFTRLDRAIENYPAKYASGPDVKYMTSTDNTYSPVGWPLVALSPDSNELIGVYGDGGTTKIVPVLWKRNNSNRFFGVANPFDPAPPALISYWPEWSDDMAYLLIPWRTNGWTGLSVPDNVYAYLYRNDGNHHYSRAPDLAMNPNAGCTSNPVTSGTYAGGVDFSPDGKLLVITERTGTKWHIYARSGDTFTQICTHPDPLTDIGMAVRFSPDGKYLAVGVSTNGTVLQIYKITGSTPADTRVTLLTTPYGPDRLPARAVQAIEWKQLMDWEK